MCVYVCMSQYASESECEIERDRDRQQTVRDVTGSVISDVEIEQSEAETESKCRANKLLIERA